MTMRDDLSTRPGSLSELGPVLGELVHDLANEVQILHGWATIARGEVAAGRAPEAELDRVVNLSADLGRMLRDVLETVSGQGLSPEVVFDPRALTESLLNDRSREMAGLDLRLTWRLPPEVRVRGRASFWTRAISNLVGNAARHARRAVAVQLWYEEEHGRGWVVAGVEDDGPGIPDEERELIFQPLWRGSQGHTGLGLSATVWLASHLGGSLRCVEGSSLGGAAFELRAPISGPLIADRPASPPRLSASALAGVRILLIDDDPGVRVALGRLLRRVGAEVREMDPRGEPLESVTDGVLRARPDVLVIDLRLGERGGVGLWQDLSTKLPGLADRVVFVSGAVPGDPYWEAAMETGRPVLAKPFDLDQLVALVDRLRSGE
jgi:CheY-like chemotaxis protein